MNQIAYLIAIFFGAGRFPKAPGTAGSLASLLIFAPIVLTDTSWSVRFVITALITVIGIWACNRSLSRFDSEDPKPIVIDEVAGMGCTLLICGPGVLNLFFGFLLFRFFDILKPWPIRVIDKQIHGGFGIMLDDIVAGIFAMMCLYVVGSTIS